MKDGHRSRGLMPGTSGVFLDEEGSARQGTGDDGDGGENRALVEQANREGSVVVVSTDGSGLSWAGTTNSASLLSILAGGAGVSLVGARRGGWVGLVVEEDGVDDLEIANEASGQVVVLE